MDQFSPLQPLEIYAAANRDLAVAMLQPTFIAQLKRAADVMESAYHQHKKLIFIGNGGSASNAAHFVVDFVKGFADFPGIQPLRSLALTDSTSTLTAIGNDLSYDEVYSRQLEAWGEEGDILIALSGSGNSPNILKAVELAKQKKMTVIGLTGNREGSTLAFSADITIPIPTPHMQHIENAQQIVLHGLWLELLSRLAPAGNTSSERATSSRPSTFEESEPTSKEFPRDDPKKPSPVANDVAPNVVPALQPTPFPIRHLPSEQSDGWCPLCHTPHLATLEPAPILTHSK